MVFYILDQVHKFETFAQIALRKHVVKRQFNHEKGVSSHTGKKLYIKGIVEKIFSTQLRFEKSEGVNWFTAVL